MSFISENLSDLVEYGGAETHQIGNNIMVAPAVLSECHNLQERESISVYNPCKKSAGVSYIPSGELLSPFTLS